LRTCRYFYLCSSIDSRHFEVGAKYGIRESNIKFICYIKTITVKFLVSFFFN